MSLSQFISKRFGKLTVDQITGGSVACTNISGASLSGSSLTGTTVSCSTFTGGLNTYAPISKGTRITATSNVTISSSQLLSGGIIRTGVTADNTNDVLPSASELISQLNITTNSQASVGTSFSCTYALVGVFNSCNTTLITGTGISIGGLTTFTSGSELTANSRVLTFTLATLSPDSFIVNP